MALAVAIEANFSEKIVYAAGLRVDNDRVKPLARALTALRALELRAVDAPAASVVTVVDALGLAFAARDPTIGALVASIAPVRERLEYGGVIHTPERALDDKKCGPVYAAGALFAAEEIVHAYGFAQPSKQATAKVGDHLLLELALLRSIRHSGAATPSELARTSTRYGLSASASSISRALKRLADEKYVSEHEATGDRRHRVYVAHENTPVHVGAPGEGGGEHALAVARTAEEIIALLPAQIVQLGAAFADNASGGWEPLGHVLARARTRLEPAPPLEILGDPVRADAYLGGALWCLTELIETYLSRHAAQRERETQRVSRGELRSIVMAVLAEQRSVSPSDVLAHLERTGSTSTPEEVSKAIRDLCNEGRLVATVLPPGVDRRGRRYQAPRHSASSPRNGR